MSKIDPNMHSEEDIPLNFVSSVPKVVECFPSRGIDKFSKFELHTSGPVEKEDEIALHDDSGLGSLDVKQKDVVGSKNISAALSDASLLPRSNAVDHKQGQTSRAEEIDLVTADQTVLQGELPVVSPTSAFREQILNNNHFEEAASEPSIIQRKADNTRSSPGYQTGVGQEGQRPSALLSKDIQSSSYSSHVMSHPAFQDRSEFDRPAFDGGSVHTNSKQSDGGDTGSMADGILSQDEFSDAEIQSFSNSHKKISRHTGSELSASEDSAQKPPPTEKKSVGQASLYQASTLDEAEINLVDASHVDAEKERSLSLQTPSPRIPNIPRSATNALATSTSERLASDTRPFSDDKSVSISTDKHETRVEMLMIKSNVYLMLKDWEEDRLTRSERLHSILDPMVNEVIAGCNSAKEANSHILRFLKDRARIAADTASRLKASSASLPKGLRFTSQNSGEGDKNALIDAKEVRNEVEAKKSRSLPIFAQSWIKALYRCNEKEAGFLALFAEGVDANIVQGKLAGAVDDYEKAVHLLLDKLKEARSRLWGQNREVRRAWFDFQKLFKEVEKAQKNKFLHLKIEIPGWLSADTFTQSVTPNENDLTMTAVAQASSHMQQNYLKLVTQGVLDVQQLENWRSGVARECVLVYLAKTRETLGLIASSLGSAHAIIDPDGFTKAKAAFLSRHPSAPPSSEPLRETNKSEQPPLPVSIPSGPAFTSETKSQSMSPSIAPSMAMSPSEEDLYATQKPMTFNPDTDPSIAAARSLIADIEVPDAQLVIKKGHVRRHAGIFGKWSEGLLVLTWDRILHMFRSFDDSQPVWSVTVPNVEIRVVEEKGGVKTIEIRDKKNLFVVLGSKSFYFRAYSEDDFSSWTRCLTLAATADDKAFRTEGLANARSADQKAFDEYNKWVRSQEIMHPDIIYGPEDVSSIEDPSLEEIGSQHS